MCAILTKSEHLYIINSDNIQPVLEKKDFQSSEKQFGMNLQTPVFLTPGEVVMIPLKVKQMSKVCHATNELIIIADREIQ